MILFTLPCGRVVVNIRNRETPPKNQKLIFMAGHIVMFPRCSLAKFKHCMTLLRLVVLEGMVYNVRISAKHVGTKQNGKADALSRLDFKRF